MTFGSLHKPEKLNDAVVETWCALLRDVPGARLLLARDALRGATTDSSLERFAGRGIDSGRVLFRCP